MVTLAVDLSILSLNRSLRPDFSFTRPDLSPCCIISNAELPPGKMGYYHSNRGLSETDFDQGLFTLQNMYPFICVVKSLEVFRTMIVNTIYECVQFKRKVYKCIGFKRTVYKHIVEDRMIAQSVKYGP